MTRFLNKKLSLFHAIIFASTSLIYFMLVFIGYTELTTTLSHVDRAESIVVDRGISIKKNRRGTSYEFYLDMQSLDRVKFRSKYSICEKLLDDVSIGDKIIVYYKKNNIIQLEKNKTLLLSIKDYQKNSLFLIIIGSIAGFGTLIFVCWAYKKGRKEKRKTKIPKPPKKTKETKRRKEKKRRNKLT